MSVAHGCLGESHGEFGDTNRMPGRRRVTILNRRDCGLDEAFEYALDLRVELCILDRDGGLSRERARQTDLTDSCTAARTDQLRPCW